MLDEEVVDVLTALLSERQLDLSLDEVEASHQVPSANNPEGRLIERSGRRCADTDHTVGRFRSDCDGT
ncbi:MAG: hypothetical protein ACJAYE_000246 [Candidatus Azotimanducaceae bacterium]|jgi:hypothetical protein